MGSAEIAAEAQRYAERTPGLGGPVRRRPAFTARGRLPQHALPPAASAVRRPRGAGSRVCDVDGHDLVDLTNNHTALVHGNAHPVVLDAVRAQLERGTCFSGPTALQVEVADRLTARLPTLERVRFCASGTEATLHAVRAARAFTGRLKIAKAEGAYHGSQDDVFVSTHPRPGPGGTGRAAELGATSRGARPVGAGRHRGVPVQRRSRRRRPSCASTAPTWRQFSWSR